MAMASAGCGGSSHPASSTSTSPPPANSSPPTSPTTPTASATAPRGSTPTARPHSAPAAADWATYHRSGLRTGAVATGPALGRVRRLWSVPVAGGVYAEPLVIGARVIVATQENDVYALDAASGRRLWAAHLGAPVGGGSLPCGNVDPSGITGTPVADPRTGTLYVVAYRSGPRHVLFALSLGTGAVRFKRPIDPPGGNYTTQQQRAALALSGGLVYVSYGGLYGDCGRYHGWVVGAPATGPDGPLIDYQVPSQNEGAVWAPSGPAVDQHGNLYVATGNGNASSFDYGNAVIRLTPGLQAISYFAPADAGALNTTDTDLGSTGPVLLPGGRAFILGKSGTGYLLSTANLGGLGHELASIALAPAFGGDAYAAGTLYVPTIGGIAAVQVAGDHLSRRWNQSVATLPPIVAGAGVWALSSGGTLYQLDSRSGAVRYRVGVGEPEHFATPAADGRRVYVAAGGLVQAFG